MDLTPERAFKMILFCSWVAYSWCILAPLGMAALEQILGLDRNHRRSVGIPALGDKSSETVGSNDTPPIAQVDAWFRP